MVCYTDSVSYTHLDVYKRQPMGQVASLAANFEQTKTAYQSLSKIMQMPVERPEGKKFVRRNSFDGKIEFKNVSFTYPDTTKGSLDRINFVIQPGEKVGIIGKNGSGKTTLQKLILGLYSPTEGSVLIDGIDINQIDPADLRRNIGYCLLYTSLLHSSKLLVLTLSLFFLFLKNMM